MGLFTKHSTTHFSRDKEGRVISTTKTGYQEKKTMWDQLAQNRQSNKEVRQKERQENRYEKRYQRQREHEAFSKARNEERIKLKSEQGRRSALHPVTGMLPPRRVVHVHVGKNQQDRFPIKKKHQMTPTEFQKRMMKGF